MTTEHSGRFSEAHFDAKASRYRAALSACPAARSLEIAPFVMLLDKLRLPPAACAAADMLCGSGFLTKGLSGIFRSIAGVDVSGGMLGGYPNGPAIRKIKAPIEEHPDVLAADVAPDVIVCLAGLHHVYERGERGVVSAPSDALQRSVIRSWARALNPGGMMVLADVTDPAEAPEMGASPDQVLLSRRVLADRYEEMRAALAGMSPGFTGVLSATPFTIAEYCDRVLAVAPQCVRAQPGKWFREIVAPQGLFGHEDHFLQPGKVLEALRDVPGITARYLEVPTPWLFPDIATFEYFFHEKFAMGAPVSSPRDIPESRRASIRDEANRYLGVHQRPCGGVTVGWRLGYYVIERV